jgi:hypothetical protein
MQRLSSFFHQRVRQTPFLHTFHVSCELVSDTATAPREYLQRTCCDVSDLLEEVRSWLTQWPAAMAGALLPDPSWPTQLRLAKKHCHLSTFHSQQFCNHCRIYSHIFTPVFCYFIYAFFASLNIF